MEVSAVLIEDIALSGESMLLLGRPGMGKTTAIREVARLLSQSSPAHARRKRVVIVDTSNEIGGDGNVPHPGVGLARRMQVPHPHPSVWSSLSKMELCEPARGLDMF